MSRLLHLVKWTNLTLVLITLLGYLAPYVSPNTFWGFALLALIYPWLLLGNILLMVFWAFQKDRYLLFSLICIIIGWPHFRSFVGLNTESSSGREDDLTIMSFNCHSLTPKGGSKEVIEPKELTRLVRHRQLDVLSFQEFPHYDRVALEFADHILEKTDLKYFFREKKSGMACFSRFPILEKHQEYFANGSNGYQYLDLDVRGKTIRLFNIHLQTNAVSSVANRVASEGKFREKETWLDIKGMMARYKRAVQIRAEQAEKLAAVISQSPHPVILNGDFNDVPLSYTYETLSYGFQDSFRKKGRGLGTTYAGKIPALRIDYILSDPLFKVIDHETLREGVSDHYPVIAVLRIPN